jgi:hypothetical protein
MADAFAVPDAAAAVAPNPLEGVHHVLTVCGIVEEAKRNNIIQAEGFTDLDSMALVLRTDEKVENMRKRMISLSVAAGRTAIGGVALERLQAFAWWARDRRMRGIALNSVDFTLAVIDTVVAEKDTQEEEQADNPDVEALGKFDPALFDVFEEKFINMLARCQGVRHSSLRYVVRPEDPPDTFADDEERRMFEMELAGPGFAADNRSVYRKLKAALLDSNGYTWIQPFDERENGRAAFLAWQEHYNGKGEKSKRLKLAQSRIDNVFYKSESSLPFEKVTSILTSNFVVLDKDPDTRLSERRKVEYLLRAIKDPDFQAARTTVQAMYAEDFAAACNFVSAVVANDRAQIQAENQNKLRNKARRIAALNGRGGGRDGGRGGGRYGGGRGRGRDGGRGRGGRGRGTMINGVDVSDPTRAFTAQEWQALAFNGGRKYVHEARERINNAHARNQGGRGGRGDGGRGGGRHVGAAETQERHNEGEEAGGRGEGGGEGRGGGRGRGERGGQNGRGFGRGAYGHHYAGR